MATFSPSPASRAARARSATCATKAVPAAVSDPFGAKRLAASKAATASGYQRLANDISRGLVGIPFTREQQDEIRAQKKGLTPQEIDRNAYCQPVVRRYAPRDTRKRHPGWVTHQFIITKRLLEGLTLLTKIKAEQQVVERAKEPYGFKRRRARGKSSFVAEAINRLLIENGLSEFSLPD